MREKFLIYIKNHPPFFLSFFPLFLIAFLFIKPLPFIKAHRDICLLPEKELIFQPGLFTPFNHYFTECNLYKSSAIQKQNLISPNMRKTKVLSNKNRGLTQNFIKTIVLDPGHGGEEVGATGHTGLLEKDVALDICRMLKEILTRNLNLRVILTRNSDVYLPLEHRIEKANNQKTDLFVSIHTNASKRREARGAESYFLSYEATDKEAEQLAALENQAFFQSSIAEDPEVDKELKLVLWDMAQAEYLVESSQLAEFIQKELNELLGVKQRGIKQAPFLVLMGAQMPAVLVEVAFITNPYEEKMLRSKAFKLKIAQALYRGIYNYIQLYNSRMRGSLQEKN